MSYKPGDTVYLLAKRLPSGNVITLGPKHPEAFKFPIHEAVIVEEDEAGLEGVYILRWSDMDEPIDGAFLESHLAPTKEALRDMVERCMVPM